SPANEALGGVDGVGWIDDGLPLGDLADEHVALLVRCDDRGREARALLVDDDLRFLTFHHRDDAVRRAQIDPDDLSHGYAALLSGSPAAGAPRSRANSSCERT